MRLEFRATVEKSIYIYIYIYIYIWHFLQIKFISRLNHLGRLKTISKGPYVSPFWQRGFVFAHPPAR